MAIKIQERPFIDPDAISDTACKPNKIRIKLRPQYESLFQRIDGRRKSRHGYIQTDNEDLNRSFRRIRAKNKHHIMSKLYTKSPGSLDFAEKHRQWDFHLWEEIELEPGTSFVDAIKHFLSANIAEVAEPIYIKKRCPEGDSQILVPDDSWLTQSRQWALHNIGQLDIDHPQVTGQYGIPGWDINIDAAWSLATGKPEVIVAVFDEGIDYNHSDIAANMWGGIGPNGYNTIPGDHGTHVAGIIGALTNNNLQLTGIAGGDGGGRGITLMSLDIFDETDAWSPEQLYIFAADNGAAISQNSWGYVDPNVYETLTMNGIAYFNANGGGKHMNGGITIFAAGNNDSEANWYPACDASCLAVAAHDNRGVKSSFSNYGTWVDISAPGTWILSLSTNNSGMWMSGTSQACPHVSGVAALILSSLYTKITSQQLRDLLLNNTRDIYSTNVGTYSGKLGTGALDAGAALMAAQALQPETDKLVYYRRGGVNYSIGLYSDPALVGAEAIAVEVDGLTYYAKLDSIAHERASYLRARRNGQTLALLDRV